MPSDCVNIRKGTTSGSRAAIYFIYKVQVPDFLLPHNNMTSELFIDVQPKKISIALTEDKRLMEYQEESQEASFQVGNVYLA